MQTPSLQSLVFSTIVAWQRPRPHEHPKARQACLEMRQGFYTHHRIKEEPEEEVSPPVDPINQWPRQDSQITPWELLGDHRQRVEQEVLLC